MDIELNPEFQNGLASMEGSSSCVFITGRAGTGKSTLLRYFRDRTKKECVYLAPTGVAALNINGQTIHSFFRFSPGITITQAKKKGAKAEKQLYKACHAFVIDEISMVRADVLDCVDVFLRAVMHSSKPFGGKQMIFIGDLYQLAPVVSRHEADAFRHQYETPYFFSAQVMQTLTLQNNVTFLELEKVYRQQNKKFVAILNGVRNRSITEEHIALLNQRVGVSDAKNIQHDTIHLTTTNAAADEVNQLHLRALSSREQNFYGERKGDFPDKDMPTEFLLTLKKGARVMFLNNDSFGRWVNGTLGTIERCTEKNVQVHIDGEKQIVDVEPYSWTLYRSVYDSVARRLDQEKLGSFTQLPLRLAWATTIHKSQGKTFDSCVVDLGRGAFAYGQVYVALSRCRTLDGIRLTKPVTRKHMLLDWRVMKFLTSLQYGIAEQQQSSESKIHLIEQAIKTQKSLRIVYLKGKDEKSYRDIEPQWMGTSEYNGHSYLALRAYCRMRKEDRIFNVQRILSVEEVK